MKPERHRKDLETTMSQITAGSINPDTENRLTKKSRTVVPKGCGFSGFSYKSLFIQLYLFRIDSSIAFICTIVSQSWVPRPIIDCGNITTNGPLEIIILHQQYDPKLHFNVKLAQYQGPKDDFMVRQLK